MKTPKFIALLHKGIVHIVRVPTELTPTDTYYYARKELKATDTEITPWQELDFDNKGISYFNWRFNV